MRMLCYKCDHPWNYKGKHTKGKGYITCPQCLYKIRSDKALIEDTFKQESLNELPKKKQLPIKLPSNLPKRIPTTIIKRPIFKEKEVRTFSEFHLEVQRRGVQNNSIEIKQIPWSS